MEKAGLVIRFQEREYTVVSVKGPKVCFKVYSQGHYLGTLCKVYNETWEWFDGEETLKDAEAIGMLIQEHAPGHFRTIHDKAAN